MCTEPYIIPLPAPKQMPAVILKNKNEWLRMIRQDAVQIVPGAVFTRPLQAQWETRPRSSENAYETNYLFYCPDADIIIQLSDQHQTVSAGTLIWMSPGIPYALRLIGISDSHRFYRCRFDILCNDTHIAPDNQPLLIPDAQWFPQICESLYTEMNIPGPFSNEAIRSIILRLGLAAFRNLEQPPSRSSLPAGALARLMSYTRERISERITPADLAAQAEKAPAYFTRIFKQAVGIAPRRWILEQRIHYGAQMLIDTMLNINEIAYQLGYEEPRLFTRQFKDVYGISPRKWRRNSG